ncbi:MAG: hypothetical protein R8N23_11930 [Reichenbachiella sp.]|uniref:hypothetical protein n=1 Tax=Reichenbachiella sp. TaxID=2184521 RepID=UPI0029666AB5|nr:hypothetical protein [Reichenbachiella sp.]MDW3210573.1 hypothetical protein [Reichenbachiella sp.]
MDLQKEIAKAHSKANAQSIAGYIGKDTQRFEKLMELFFHKEYKVSQRAAHAVSHCVDRHPKLLEPYINQMIENLREDPKVAIKRNTVRLLQKQEIPEESQGLLLDKCFEYLTSAKETTAVKAFSMTIAHNLTKIYPELKIELKIVIEDLIQYATPGVVNRGKKILVELG